MALHKCLLNRRMVVLGFILLLWLVTGLPILRALLLQTTTIIGDADRSLLAGTLLYVQGQDGLWRVNLPDGEPHRWWYDETLTDISGVAASPTEHQLAVVAAPLPDDGLSMVGATQIYLMNPAGTTLTPIGQRERSNIS